MSAMFIETISVKPNSFCWQGTYYCGKCSLTCIHKTKHQDVWTAFLLLLYCDPGHFSSLVSFLFIWNCRFKWSGMWWAYLMFCTLSGNVPAPKTEQSSGKHLKCNPDTVTKHFLPPSFPLPFFCTEALIENSSPWKCESWIFEVNIWKTKQQQIKDKNKNKLK